MREEDERIRDAALRSLYEGFEESPWGTFIADSVIEDVQDDLENVDENDIQYVLKRMDDESLISKEGPDTVQLNAKGIDELSQENADTFLDGEDWKDLVEILYTAERENPQNSKISPEELLDELNISEKDLDYNVWYLDQKRLAEAHLQIGGDHPYYGVEITNQGRNFYENKLLDN